METKNEKNNKPKSAREISGLLFAGCLFIGMALGYYFNHLLIGLFIGMGIGFIMMAVTTASINQHKS